MLKGKKNPILVPHGEKKHLKKLFSVSYNTLTKALNGNTNTELQRRIRKAAIECGGKEYEPLN